MSVPTYQPPEQPAGPQPPPTPQPPAGRPGSKRHVLRWVLAAAALIGIGVAIGAVSIPRTVTQKYTVGVNVPGPTVTSTTTVTASPPAPPPPATLFSQSGSRNWNSPPFQVTGAVLTVVFSYSGNQDSNFIAGLVSDQGDDLSIANEIGSTGGKTTTLYPNGAGGSYHLEITAQGDWTFKITQSG